VLFGLQPFVEGDSPSIGLPSWWPVGLLLLVNGIVISALLFFRDLYRSVERLMKFLVAVMMFGFAANLILAKPVLGSIAGGLVPGLPANFTADSIVPVTGLMATTFSIAAAFYQAYLVRQKGWDKDDLGDGLTDTFVGIGMLGAMSLMVMLTAASVLHGSADANWTSAADVAMQLRPLFGPFATILFCAGIFAGALSSFLVNAMIGGTVMADAIGKGADINGPWTRGLTIVLLLFGMVLAIAVRTAELDIGRLIMIAQAVTVLGNPFLAGTMLYLAYTPSVREQNIIPAWVRGIGWIGFAVVILLSIRTLFALYVKLTSI
ncbi:NRAMP family divalent metal transporter, partial [Planctomycetota bacterium]